MDINEVNQKIQNYTTEQTQLTNDKNRIDQELAVVNNQIENNKKELINQFGTDNETEILNSMSSLEQEITTLEQEYNDIKDGKKSLNINVSEIQESVQVGAQQNNAPVVQQAPQAPSIENSIMPQNVQTQQQQFTPPQSIPSQPSQPSQQPMQSPQSQQSINQNTSISQMPQPL